MSKRSPILGYNHNISHRGLVFHVQSEDSGMQNPHLFTHVFHGGVILGTRKLVYDNQADQEVVKALMQAQHKAVLKDLKRGKFDSKIDMLLADTAGLLPARASSDRDTIPTEALTSVPQPRAAAVPVELSGGGALSDGTPMLEILAETPSHPVPIIEIFADEPDFYAGPPVIELPPPRSPSSQPNRPAIDVDLPPPHSVVQTEPMLVLPSFEEAARADDSSAVVRDGQSQTGSPPRGQPSAGSYSQVRRKQLTPSSGVPHSVERISTDKVATVRTATPNSGVPARPSSAPGMGSESRRIAAGAQARAAQPQATAVSGSIETPSNGSAASNQRPGPPPTAPARPAAAAQRAPSAPSKSRQPTRPVASPSTVSASADTPAPPRTQSRPEGKGRPPSKPPPPQSGVVVSRPAVIIGAPPRVVGGPSGGSDVRRSSPRRAREEGSRSSLFGKDLISEKSLDEVILAYLSEDSSEE